MASLSLIAAADRNDVIGRGGDLAWHLPSDLRRFKSLTLGHILIMGRVTYDSIVKRLGKPLPDRVSVVVSHGQLSPGEAMREALKQAATRGQAEAMVIGGAQIYTLLLPHVRKVYLTRVEAEVEGDTTMPAGWLDQFRKVSREPVERDPRDEYPSSFEIYRRSQP